MILLNEKQVKRIIYRDKTKSYTYGLCRNDGSLYYVGVGKRNRVLQHVMEYELKSSNNRLKVNITKNEIAKGGIYFVIFLCHSDRNVCLNVEAKLVQKYGRIDNLTGTLANLTDGGEIGPSGVVVSDETKMKLSEARRKASEHLSLKNKEYWNTLSDEEKESILCKMQSKRADPAKLSVKLLERWSNPEYKARLSEKQKQSQKLVAETHRETMRKKWADPEFREYMLNKRREAKERKKTLQSNLIDQLIGE